MMMQFFRNRAARTLAPKEAAVGFLMLTGRIEWRRGLTVVIGCFIIFGAVAIVSGIRSLAGGLH